MVLFIGSVIRTILIIIAVMVIVRFVGKLLSVKRDIAEEKQHNKEKSRFNAEKERIKQNEGNVRIVKGNQHPPAEEVDYEEIKNDSH